MVKVKESTSSHFSLEEWLGHLAEKGYGQDLGLLRHAVALAELSGQDYAVETGETCFRHGLAMADVLVDLGMDLSSIAAGIIYSSVQYADLSLDVIGEQLGFDVSRLIKGVMRMNALSTPHPQAINPKKPQHDNWRKMLLAMVDDVRVVLIKLADRLCLLRAMAHMPEAIRRQFAEDSMNIYAPLAHRLGIGAIKWEIEDLGFRYLYPEEYKTIAKGLRSKRLERDSYVNWIVGQLQTEIKKLGIDHFSIYGRSKHIHSIYNKMRRKQVALNEIYDATAVRILAETKEECYEVLSLVHALWTPIPKEFDDYISHPKGNGYQSLHTAVVGPKDRIFEVQIRTFAMHQLAEMGVAAHWKYKEGGEDDEFAHEQKISWLRNVLSWHQEVEAQTREPMTMDNPVIDDRIYVFTPAYEVIDLQKGSTPLDFAYYLHTDIGHRCRGAKINGAIVPLNQTLKTADRIEILMAKEAKPSRDWLTSQGKYLHTAKAKAKVFHWFKKQDYDLHCQLGQNLVDKELKQAHYKLDRLEEVLEDLSCKTIEDLYAGVGRGDIKVSQILSRLAPHRPPVPKLHIRSNVDLSKQVVIEGVGHLLTHFAKCCQPGPGDQLVGYMTLGRGVSIHQQQCKNVAHANEEQQKRFLKVNWAGEELAQSQFVTLKFVIDAYDRPDLLKDVTNIISKDQIRLISLQTRIASKKNINHVQLTLELDNLQKMHELQKDMAALSVLIAMKRIS